MPNGILREKATIELELCVAVVRSKCSARRRYLL